MREGESAAAAVESALLAAPFHSQQAEIDYYLA
jgi:hypothetical protein